MLDQTNKTATLVWEYRNTPDVFAWGMGNVQRLPNGNTMIGWGTAVPTLTEVTPDGRKAFELTMDLTHQSYRAFRFTWEGRPSWPPTLVAVREGGSTRLVTSWNGATEVGSYRVYGGMTPNAVTSSIRTVTKTGFETSTDVTAQLDDFCFFRVRPIDRQGQAMTYSNVVAVRGESCRACFCRWLVNDGPRAASESITHELAAYPILPQITLLSQSDRKALTNPGIRYLVDPKAVEPLRPPPIRVICGKSGNP